jgi:hypothetical protein
MLRFTQVSSFILLRSIARSVLYGVGVTTFFVGTYLLVLWWTCAFVVTHNGPIQWQEGWFYAMEHIGVIQENEDE